MDAGADGGVNGCLALRECSCDDAAQLKRIGRLRYEVWEGEGSVSKELFPDRVWVDDMDTGGGCLGVRHWFVENRNGELVAAARLTLHGEKDEYRDVELWKSKEVPLNWPVCDLGRLVVRKDARGAGLATRLNRARVDAAKEWGAGAVICTASAPNASLLSKHHGFAALGQTMVFKDRPKTTFHAIHLMLT